MDFIDVSHWKKHKGLQASGVRSKFWLLHPETGQKFLFKIPLANTGEAWAEKIASDLAKLLKFPSFECFFAIYQDKKGVLLKSFVDESEEEFYEGIDLFSAHIEGFQSHQLDGYTIDTIMEILRPLHLDRDFVHILIFDALIGNQDRHCQNWGIIRNWDGSCRLAPAYDNGSSLGQLLTEDKIKKMLSDRMMFQAYIQRGYSMIGILDKKKPKFLVLLDHVKQIYSDEISQQIIKLEVINDISISEILSTVPDVIMTKLQKEFVQKLIIYRKEWLIKWKNGE